MNTELHAYIRAVSSIVVTMLILAATPSAAQTPNGGMRAGQSPANSQAPGQALRRMAPMPQNQLTDEQKALMEYYKSKRGMELRGGLFMDLLRVPEAMRALFDLRLYVQQEISFGDALSEFAELIVLREWNSRNEFSGHTGIAYRAGVKPEIIHAIAEGRYPAGMSQDEAVIYHFITELLENKNVSDPTYAAMVKRFGERGVIEAITLTTLYSAVGMVYNTVREPVPDSWAPMPDFPQMAPVPLSEYSNPRRFQQQPGGAAPAMPPMTAPRPAAPPPETK